MLLPLERSPHCLHLGVGFKVGICLGIFESHLLVALEKIDEQKGIDTLVLPLGLYTDQQHVKSVRFASVHALEKMVPTEREYLSVALLQSLSHRRNGDSGSNEFTFRIFDESKHLHIHKTKIYIHILVYLLL